jgi:hypothetical protein
MIPICRHIKTDGARCKANALRVGAFNYFHGRAPRTARPARFIAIFHASRRSAERLLG